MPGQKSTPKITNARARTSVPTFPRSAWCLSYTIVIGPKNYKFNSRD